MKSTENSNLRENFVSPRNEKQNLSLTLKQQNETGKFLKRLPEALEEESPRNRSISPKYSFNTDSQPHKIKKGTLNFMRTGKTAVI